MPDSLLSPHRGNLLRLLMSALLIVVPDQVLQHRGRAVHIGDPVSLAQLRQASLKNSQTGFQSSPWPAECTYMTPTSSDCKMHRN
jgi:hypothetical protein